MLNKSVSIEAERLSRRLDNMVDEANVQRCEDTVQHSRHSNIFGAWLAVPRRVTMCQYQSVAVALQRTQHDLAKRQRYLTYRSSKMHAIQYGAGAIE